MSLANWLLHSAQNYSSLPAVALGKAIWQDYGTLALRAARLAGALQKMGLQRGDRIALYAPNCREYLEILYAIWWGGFAAVPLNYKLHEQEALWILENCGAKLTFTTLPLNANAIEIGSLAYEKLFQSETLALVDIDENTLAWLFYTSGTTGKPKGAMLSHKNFKAASYAYRAEIDEVTLGSRLLHAAPMSHGSGCYIKPHILAGGVQIIPESGGFDPFEIAELTRHWGGVSMFAAPTMIKRLVENKADVRGQDFKTIIWGGAPMYVSDTLKALDRFGGIFAQIYGQGESPMTITHLSKAEVTAKRHLESAGRPYGMMQVKLAEDGEILAKGDPVMLGYYGNEKATNASLKDGWLYTGDVGEWNEAGYLVLKDRSKDVIISGGSNIYPREVEEVLLKHPQVQEVCVIGRPDADWGEVVVAYVVGKASENELEALCLNSIARFKKPKAYVFVESLPKSNYGKILKRELRELDAQTMSTTST